MADQQAVSSMERVDMWDTIGSVGTRETLQRDIEKYFGVNENLSGFSKRNGSQGIGLELQSPSEDRGYVFVGPLQLERDIRNRLNYSREVYERSGKRKIIREFVDHESEIAGFSWRSV